MSRNSYYLSNVALLAGLAIVGSVVYASYNRMMDWAKLIVFWLGASGMGFFLLYRILARARTYRRTRPVYLYPRWYRILCALLLLLGLWAAISFNYLTLATWQKPAFYWELLAQEQPSANQYAVVWKLGNQRFRETVQLESLRLTALADVALADKKEKLEIVAGLDSITVSVQPTAGAHTREIQLPEPCSLPPLRHRTLTLHFDYRQHFAIFSLAATYRNVSVAESPQAKATTFVPQTVVAPQYVLIEPSFAGVVEFSELARRVRRPAAQTHEPLILALGRSGDPQALAVLLELLQGRDPKVKDAACRGLAELRDSRANPALIRLINRENHPQAVRALGMIGSEEGIEFLVRLLGDDQREPYLRTAAAGVLSESSHPLATKALVALLRQKAGTDVLLQREGLLALVKMNDSLAAQLTLEMAREPRSGEQVRVLIEVMRELEVPATLPRFAEWLRNWRRYDLTLDDVQLMLDYIVAGAHTNMVATLIDILNHEPTTEAQSRLVQALSRLVQQDLGTIHFPALNHDMVVANERVISAWQQWWGQARKQPGFANQIVPTNTSEQL
ncbi:MAG: HEAT repeat domain-containing protein [candidate division KSB1 bacterium]|nr:HEAT repeat domain-containing protein [candidate division KSB1 bacterium]MDZ7275540.1 HEAT repeat domain-containing protein [candidate division KSB1 bacterium]MDZ7286148.1 HEAT repeat domain-containing protein [candidate division KSB1 bacterium]MDZ7296374.1 HEAT repeat domain-containing protein [candidate division KSB1 bacterium]MDZ7309344.1 HEAT repeat domain-containing protein [candidate division KSB1 bacterium]